MRPNFSSSNYFEACGVRAWAKTIGAINKQKKPPNSDMPISSEFRIVEQVFVRQSTKTFNQSVVKDEAFISSYQIT